MRNAACVGYLCARTSDTVADHDGPAGEKHKALDSFAGAVNGGSFAGWSDSLLRCVNEPGERVLLEHAGGVLRLLETLPERERILVRDVMATIISGQRLDLDRFGDAGGVMPDREALEDYIWRVAGCVGAFWTKLGFAMLGPRFSSADESDLLATGIRFGTALQLVNVLRDVGEDLRAGRCYLPVAEPENRKAFLMEYAHWLDVAEVRAGDGLRYAAAMNGARLRLAAALPARLALQTVALLRAEGDRVPGKRVKVPRSSVYLAMLKSFF